MTSNNEFSIRLLCHDVKVAVESPKMWSVGGLGRTSLKLMEIALCDEMPADIKHSVLLHEIIHLIADMHSMEITEQQIDAISIGFFSLLRDNHELIRDIAGMPGSNTGVRSDK